MSRRHRRLFVGLFVGLSACARPSQEWPLGLGEWPSSDVYVAAVLLHEGHVVDSTGLASIDDLEPLRLSLDSEDTPLEAWALGYPAETLEGLRYLPDAAVLESSRLAETLPEDWALPAPALTRGGPVGETGVEPSTWPGLRLTTSWCTPVEPCALHDLQARRIEIPGRLRKTINIIERLDDTRAVVFVSSSVFELTLPDGPIVPLTELSTSTGFVKSARVGSDLYVVGLSAAPARIQLEPSYSIEFLPPPRTPRTVVSPSIAAGVAEGAVELYLWSNLGLLERFDGQAWETVWDFQREVVTDRQGLAWIGPGHVAFFEESPPTLHVLEAGQLISIAIPARPRMVFYEESLGLLVGTDLAQLFRLENNKLELLPDIPFIGDSIHLVGRFGRGFAYAQDDSLGYFDPDVGWCLPSELGGNTGRIISVVEFPGGLLFGGNLGEDDAATLMFAESQAEGRPVCLAPAQN